MRRRIAIALLTLGTVVGFGSGIAHVVHGHGHCHDACNHGEHYDPGADHRADPAP
jgi:hypothetical protein